MPRIRLERGPVVCEQGVLATTAWTRSKGLLGRSGMADDEGLWIQPTSSIHMWFMRFAIDVVWAADDGRVLKLVEAVQAVADVLLPRAPRWRWSCRWARSRAAASRWGTTS